MPEVINLTPATLRVTVFLKQCMAEDARISENMRPSSGLSCLSTNKMCSLESAAAWTVGRVPSMWAIPSVSRASSLSVMGYREARMQVMHWEKVRTPAETVFHLPHKGA